MYVRFFTKLFHVISSTIFFEIKNTFVVFVKIHEMCDISHRFGLESDECAAVG
jgi:hypothetical protein